MRNLIVLALSFSFLSLADDQSGKTTETISTPTKTASVSMGPGFALYDGDLGYGTGFTAALNTPIKNLSAGLEFGFYQWIIGDNTVADRVFTIIPLMATAKYRFDATSSIHPYFGASAGVSFLNRSDSRVLLSGATPAKEEGTEFLFHVRPGVDLDVTNDGSFSIYVEAKTGVLRSQMLFLPQVGAVFGF